MKKKSAGIVFMVWFVVMACCFQVFGFGIKKEKGALESLAFVAPELRVVETSADFRGITGEFASSRGISAFLTENGDPWSVTVDLRRGIPSLLDGGAIPFLPGAANSLAWSSFAPGCGSIQCLPAERVEAIAREFLDRYPGLFPVTPGQLVLDREGTIAIGESLYFLRFQWIVDGIPVEKGSIYFRINNGNLVQVASTRIAPVALDTTPSFTPETAWQILNGYLGDAGITEKDSILDRGRLVIIPTTRKGLNANIYSGNMGEMATFNLAYRLVFRRPGVTGTWEAIIDAHTGEILRFVDTNRYGSVHGGVYTTDGFPPEADRPFPFADIGGGLYSNEGGTFSGNNATVTLVGKYTHIEDDCGSISNATTTGDVDFGMSSGTDCTTPTPNNGGPGNTHSARTLFYMATQVNMKARTYLPTNTWLNTDYITCIVNQPAWCNATSGGGTINFYQSTYDCNNLGEIPGVALHEWGHSMDDFDGSGGDSPPVETRADWTATLQTHDSCTGRGAFIGAYCNGYGDPCTDCSGIRDADRTKHTDTSPWTAANGAGDVYDCGGAGSYNGPCGWEDHCESGISTQALWELVMTDLPALSSMDVTSAWMLVDRLFYSSMPTLGDMYTCTPPTSNGCGGTSIYTTFRAIDDTGDGTANGTPNAAAIFSALNRHNIACGASGDATNQNQTSCPSLAQVIASGSAGSNSSILSWSAVTDATRYFVFRNDTGCDAGFTRIATVTAPTVTYTDLNGTNGLTSYYRVQAVTGNDSCVGPMSDCVSVTPQPCAGTVTLDSAIYNCASTVNVTVLDSTAPASPFTVSAWSTTDSTVKTIQVAGSPSTYTGSFTLTTGAAGPTQVQVADGATVTVRYVDADYCGTPNVDVDMTAVVDCAGPVISNVLATNVTGNSATITWTTSENANSTVNYGTATPPGSTVNDLTNYVTSHSVLVTGLLPCTTYYFSVASVDLAGNGTTEDNGGAYYTFTTGVNVNPTYASTDVPKAIPDNTTVTSTIAVADDKVIQDLNVTITNITHTYDGDLDIFIIAPDAAEVELSTDNGGTGENYVDTVFDDSAATSITSGAAPFTGTFKPEGSLASFNGKNATGTWTLEVADDAGGDTGTLNGWSITFTYPPQSCGAALEYQDSVFTDTCSGTGTGAGNGFIDPGEDIVLEVTLHNNGTSGTTGISATIESATSGVTVTDNSASFPDIAMDGTGASLSNHFGFSVDESVACGTNIDFTIHITSNEGSWDDTFSLIVGNVVAGGAVTIFSENFDSLSTPALPAGWTTQVISGNAWVTYSSYSCSTPNQLNYPYNYSQAANSWVFTHALTLQAGVTYNFSFNQRVAGATYPENGSVWLGTSANSAGMTTQLWGMDNLTNTTCTARSATFTVPSDGTYYIGFHCTSAANMWRFIIDDVVLSYTQAPSCTVDACTGGGGCTPPTTPVVTVEDVDPCAADGVSVSFTGGEPATRYDLYVDGTLAASDITSPAVHVPGDDLSHDYVVRAVNGSDTCYTDSSVVAASDLNGGSATAPVITSILDQSILQLGLKITFTPGSPAQRHDLYRDGTLVFAGFSSGAIYNPGNTMLHHYQVAAVNGACATFSNDMPATDQGTRLQPRPRLPLEPLPFDPQD